MAAALDIDQFVKQLEGLFVEVSREFPNIIQQTTLEAKALLRNRIQNQGLNDEEVAFPAYSERYKQYKEKAGKYTGKTDLTFTGRMLGNLKIVETGHGPEGHFATLGADASDNADKLKWNEQRYKNILGLTKKEEGMLADSIDDAIQQIIDKKGFGK